MVIPLIRDQARSQKFAIRRRLKGCSGTHGQRTTEKKGLHLDLKRFFYRNSGEKKKDLHLKLDRFSVRVQPEDLKKGLPLKLERYVGPNSGEDQKKKGLQVKSLRFQSGLEKLFVFALISSYNYNYTLKFSITITVIQVQIIVIQLQFQLQLQ